MGTFLRTGVVAFFATRVAFRPFLTTILLAAGFNPAAFPDAFAANVAARGFLTTTFLPTCFHSTRLAATLLPTTLPAAFRFIGAFFFWMMMLSIPSNNFSSSTISMSLPTKDNVSFEV